MTTFGPPIQHDGGEMPAWLGKTGMMVTFGKEKDVVGAPIDYLDWPDVTAFRLPADHFAYTALERDFVPWGGGDGPPSDWDGGEVLLRYKAIIEPRNGFDWSHCPSGGDIIGYRRRAEPVEVVGEAVKAHEKDAEFLRETAGYFESRPTGGEDRAHWANVYNAENCRRIASVLENLTPTPQPPVVSEVTQADRDAARAWNMECMRCSQYDGDYEADLAEAFRDHRLAHSTPETPDERAAGEDPTP